MQGIYTLANDAVYDQLIALLNSIDVNIGSDVPVCVIPYNDNMTKVIEEIKKRQNVTLFSNQESLERWDRFRHEVWEAHPRFKASRLSRNMRFQRPIPRKFASFDGDFEEFVFFDADSLAMRPITDVFEKLKSYDLVFDDWEHTKRDLSTELDVTQVAQALGKEKDQVYSAIHCDSFFGSKKDLFNEQVLNSLKEELIEKQKISWVRYKCWWSSSALFNCMTFNTNYSKFNFTQSTNSQERTGNCADSDLFVNINNVLYNEQGLKPIHRIHYMNYSSQKFQNLCSGIDEDVRYKNIFLYYRFLLDMAEKPETLREKTALEKLEGVMFKVKRKIQNVLT